MSDKTAKSAQEAVSLSPFDKNNSQTYPAGCHCGTVQLSVLLSPRLPQWKVVSCNCSICASNGYLLVYPERSQVTVMSGGDALRDYTFHKKKILHKFCGKCGSSVFFDPRMKEFGEGEGHDLLGVNVRMFKDVKIEELDVVHVDNRDS